MNLTNDPEEIRRQMRLVSDRKRQAREKAQSIFSECDRELEELTNKLFGVQAKPAVRTIGQVLEGLSIEDFQNTR